LELQQAESDANRAHDGLSARKAELG